MRAAQVVSHARPKIRSNAFGNPFS